MVSVSPPVPSIAPENVPLAFDSVRVLAPSATAPLPDRLAIEVPPFRPEMSNLPLSARPLDEAIVPAPDSASVAPELIVVAPA